MIALREAGPADAARLALLGRDSFTETFGHLYDPADLALFLEGHSEAAWRAELSDPAYRVLVGEADGAAVAYAKLGPPKLPFTTPDRSAELRQFYVLAPWHGSGAAAAMMDWTVAAARAGGAEALYLSVFVANHRARRFYEKRGFVAVGRYDFRVGTQIDEDHVMRLAL